MLVGLLKLWLILPEIALPPPPFLDHDDLCVTGIIASLFIDFASGLGGLMDLAWLGVGAGIPHSPKTYGIHVNQ